MPETTTVEAVSELISSITLPVTDTPAPPDPVAAEEAEEAEEEDDRPTCARCGEHCDEDDMDLVYTNRRMSIRDSWCQSCCDDHAFTCERSNLRFDSDVFSQVRMSDGEYVCEEYNADDIYYWDSDGRYHDDPEPEEDEEDDSESVPSYHSAERPWLFNKDKRDLIGVELEMDSNDRDATTSFAQDCGLIAELDGSLSSSTGIEIIGPPLLFDSYRDDKGAWARFLSGAANHGATRAWDAGKGYGIHVSLNRRNLSRLDCGKLQAFIHNNRSRCEMVAGREQQHWAMYHDKGQSVKPECFGKYSAVNLDNRERVEIRIFRSTLKREGFMRCVEFADAVRDFVRQAPIKGLEWPAFMEYISGRRKTYKNLMQHIISKGVV